VAADSLAMPISLLLAILIISIATVIQRCFGIGLGLIAAPLLFLLNPHYVPLTVLSCGFLLSLAGVIQARRQLNWRRVFPALLARIPGAWLGALLLSWLSPAMLAIGLGLTLLAATTLSWKTLSLSGNRRQLAVAGFFSGLLATTTSVGGPPMALVYQQQARHRARDELALFFLAGTPVSLLLLALHGHISAQHQALLLPVLPGVWLGYVIARRLDNKLPQNSVKPVLLLFSALSAMLITYQGVSALRGW